MIDADTCAAGAFVREIRSFADRIRPWDVAIRHHVLPDEVRDPTLVSQRVYGRRDEFLAVMAAAGVDVADQPLPTRTIVLPTEGQLAQIKRRAGFESRAELRESGTPAWKD